MANTILVVDDEKNIVQLARLYLGNEGFRVEEAYDGKQALEKARTVNPDLVSPRHHDAGDGRPHASAKSCARPPTSP